MFVPRSPIALSLLFTGLALLGCSTPPMSRRSMSPQSAEAANTKPAPRPILYFAAEGEGQSRELVIRAIHPGGRSLGTLAKGQLGGWSRQGDRFAYLVTNEVTGTQVVKVMGLGNRPDTVFETNRGQGAVLAPGQSIWSPDGSMIALLLGDGRTLTLGLVEVAKKKLVKTFELPRSVQPGGEEEREEGALDPLYVYVRWSPDGRKILVGSAALDLERNAWEAIADRRVIAEWLPGSDGVYFFELRQTGGDLFLKKIGQNGVASVLAGSTLAGWGVVSFGSDLAPLLKLSPSRSRLAIAAWARPEEVREHPLELATTVLVFDIPADRPVSLGEPAKRVQVEGILVAMAWGPDDRELAVLSLSREEDLMIRVVDLDSGASTSLAKMTVHTDIADLEGFFFLLNKISWCD